ncbi:IucA/IucC family protein [Staphylococcus lutrae]|uniref:Sialic acid synthase n=1 Tax=Staphylococcus lutrae TaxID=155085 RepID=A0AAC9RV41_9STAP|nr:IucA/IucC family protein [Staphylococcus lutrae]ARJ50332.1 sialic acid synthase [Staphylococcus lutrae]PNZ36561.1 sialic acid synthase [Staphylococcus lutrae]
METEQNHLEMAVIDFTKDEKETYQTLLSQDTGWATQFKQRCLLGRDKITARLVASLYRENLVNGYTHSDLKRAEQLQNSPITSGELLCIHFKRCQKTLYAPVVSHHAFNRIDVQGPFYWETQSGVFQRILHPNEVLDMMIEEDPQYQGEAANQFRDDLENSATHMTLALSYQAQHPLNDVASLLQYIQSQSDSYLTSEQLVIEGHPIHPGAKLRKGMSAKETIAYSSEYQQAIPMQFILIHKSMTRTMAQAETYLEVVYPAFKGLKNIAQHALPPTSTLDEYVPFIVHPWQYEHVILKDYHPAFESQMIVPLDYSIDYYAGLSFRTLMPKKPTLTPHIKLSTNVHITGEIRTLSEQTTYNGPLMTRILTHITQHDPLLDHVPTSPVPEIAGAHYYNDQNGSTEIQERLSEQLGTLFRQNIYALIEPDLLPCITSSLVVTHPQTGRPLIVDLVERYQTHNNITGTVDACAEWFTTYANALISYVVPLLVKYGIALEAHLQNAIAVFHPHTGQFSHMLIRDFEGLRIDATQLAKMGYHTDHFHEKSRILTTSQTSVFNKAFYSTIQNHLGEMVASLARFYDHPEIEAALWHIVRQQMVQIFQRMKADGDIASERIDAMYQTFFNETIDYKCVTTMRLLDEAHEYTYIKVKNPLAR